MTEEKKSTTLTPDVIMQIAEKNRLMIRRDQAEKLIADHKEFFRGHTLKGSDVVELIRSELGLETKFDALVQKTREAEGVA